MTRPEEPQKKTTDAGVSLSANFRVFSFDMAALLPVGWVESVSRCLAEHAAAQDLRGESSTSRENASWADTRGLVPARALVADGRAIRSVAPWLDSLYRGPFLEAANSLGDEKYECAHDLASGVNINAIAAGDRYEWHVDSNPLTGVLFLSGGHDGGDLVFRPDSDDGEWSLRITPEVGRLLLFDAREVAHTVEPVLGNDRRVSVPMNYYVRGETQARPADLDRYLYGATAP